MDFKIEKIGQKQSYQSQNQLIHDEISVTLHQLRQKKTSPNKKLTEEDNVWILNQLFLAENGKYANELKTLGIKNCSYSFFHSLKSETATQQLGLLEEHLMNIPTLEKMEKSIYFEDTNRTKHLNTTHKLFNMGHMILRAVCLKEVENRLVKGENSQDDYVSTSLVPAAKSPVGMNLFGSDPVALIIDPTGVPVHTKENKKNIPNQIVGLYFENKATKYIGGREQKQEKSEADNIDGLADKIFKKTEKSTHNITNSEVLWVGLTPDRIQGICIRVNHGKVPSDEILESFVKIIKQKAFRSKQAVYELYPIFIYREKSPHDLIELKFSELNTVESLRKQIHLILNPIQMIEHSRGFYELTMTHKYEKGDGLILENLRKLCKNSQSLSLAALLDKLCNAKIGWIRLSTYRAEILNMIEIASSKKDFSKILTMIHANMDIDSINYNLAQNQDRQLSAKACDSLKLGKCASYIFRRQLIVLTDSNSSKEPIKTAEIEASIAFIEEESNVMPNALSKFSKNDRWITGYDDVAVGIIFRIGGIEKMQGTFPAPKEIKMSEIMNSTEKLIKEME